MDQHSTCVLPRVPDGFHVSVFAREPMVRNPCAMAFDARGRLFVSQGPQYRRPKPDTPGDRITILIDSDGDGAADKSKTFAEGFNHIQGLAWRGDELWVANAPELTVVRDLDGDDEADEYTIIYGGLGNLEHGLHGLNFAPDGRLYMSKGNSKGYLDADSPELYVAPQAFAELWGMRLPEGAPATPAPITFNKDEYKKGFHNPADDWGSEGGILRCDADGSNLEIFSRGMRNPWDIAYDEHFNWLGTDQDQDGGDRIISPFLGAHFGWGHAWSPHWTGEDHLPTVPIAGPLFHGSGTGVVYCVSEKMPARYRSIYFVGDWLQRTIYVYRPRWDGALIRNMKEPEVFAAAPRGRSLGSSSGMVFDPADLEIGPDGALWVLSWGHGYGANIKNGEQQDEGRVYRISCGPAAKVELSHKYEKPYAQWSPAELIEDLHHGALPVRRINAQDELVRRGNAAKKHLLAALAAEDLRPGAATWLAWTLGRLDAKDQSIDDELVRRAANGQVADRVQALRILACRNRQQNRALPGIIEKSLADQHARIRLAAVQAIHGVGQRSFSEDLWKVVASETDRGVYYAAWRALGDLLNELALREKLSDPRPGVRRATMLALLEQGSLSGDQAARLRLDEDRATAEIATSFVEKVGTTAQPVLTLEPAETNFDGTLQVQIVLGPTRGLHARFTLDGSDPSDTSGQHYQKPISLDKSTIVKAALFRGRVRVGPVLVRSYQRTGDANLIGGDSAAQLPIRNLHAGSGSNYRTARLSIGLPVYTNRQYVWKEIPGALIGSTVIQPANDDADVGSRRDGFLNFRVDEPAVIYVAHDCRIQAKPDWLREFAPTQIVMRSDDTTFQLHKKRFPAGNIALGGNTTDGQTQGRSQYAVVVTDAPLLPRTETTTVPAALAHLKSADAGRGARLFFGAAACSKCHRLGDRGHAFAPNLSNLGQRADARAVAESILNPDAVITEGFQTLNVITVEGRQHSGFLRQESGLVLKLIGADGQPIAIRKADIDERVRLDKSAMPSDMGKLLAPQQVADLTSFILAHNDQQSSDENAHPMLDETVAHAQLREAISLSADAWGERDDGFHLCVKDNELQIHLDGQAIASYVFRHKDIKRPFFAHVKTQGGIQVTRNFPPVKGQDPTDHHDMHPGLWMAFGNVSGIDFWRNQGSIVHEGFMAQPAAGDVASFATVNRFESPRGMTICRLQTRFKFARLAEGWMLTIDAEFIADKDLYFGVQEEMGLGFRVATPISVRSGGTIVNSTGGRNEKGTWGHVADWWNYFGVKEERAVGIMLMNHPDNEDVWSHSRDSGLLVANPFHVDRKVNRGEKINMPANKPLRLRFGVLVHETPEPGAVDHQKAYRNYLNQFAPEKKRTPTPEEQP